MAFTKIDIVITLITLAFLSVGGWSIGYSMGRHSPCNEVESIDMKPIP